jgi:hypothetical protein
MTGSSHVPTRRTLVEMALRSLALAGVAGSLPQRSAAAGGGGAVVGVIAAAARGTGIGRPGPTAAGCGVGGAADGVSPDRHRAGVESRGEAHTGGKRRGDRELLRFA